MATTTRRHAMARRRLRPAARGGGHRDRRQRLPNLRRAPTGTWTSRRRPERGLSLVDNQYLVAWHGDDSANTEFEVVGQRLSGGGHRDRRQRLPNLRHGPQRRRQLAGLYPSVAYSSTDDQWLVVWSGDDDTAPLVNGEEEIFGQRLTGAGVEGGTNDFRISDMGPNSSTVNAGSTPSVACRLADNQWLVTWYGDDNSPPLVDNELEIFGQRLDYRDAAASTTSASPTWAPTEPWVRRLQPERRLRLRRQPVAHQLVRRRQHCAARRQRARDLRPAPRAHGAEGGEHFRNLSGTRRQHGLPRCLPERGLRLQAQPVSRQLGGRRHTRRS